jgi:ABC-type amino acid transport substrate-binding protein
MARGDAEDLLAEEDAVGLAGFAVQACAAVAARFGGRASIIIIFVLVVIFAGIFPIVRVLIVIRRRRCGLLGGRADRGNR